MKRLAPAFAVASLALAAAMPARAENICVANGQTYRQGEMACLKLPCVEPYLARCSMVLNNSSWQKIADRCPEAEIPASTRVASAAPVSTPRR